MGTSVTLVWNKSNEAYLNNRESDFDTNYEYVFKLSYHCLSKIDFDYEILNNSENDEHSLEILLKFADWLDRVFFVGKNLPETLKDLHWLLHDKPERYDEVMTDLEISALRCREAYYKGKRLEAHGLKPRISVG